jgi:hypothetical protein
MFKVGDRVEWCRDGNFEKYGESDSPANHDFGEVTKILGARVFVGWDSGGSSIPVTDCIRKSPPKAQTYTKTQIKAFLETLRENRDSWFESERKIAEQVFDWFETFANKPTQNEE